MGGAAARARDVVPAGRERDARRRGHGIDVEDGKAVAERGQVDVVTVGRAQVHERHAHTGQVGGRTVVDRPREVRGEHGWSLDGSPTIAVLHGPSDTDGPTSPRPYRANASWTCGTVDPVDHAAEPRAAVGRS